MVDGKEEDFSDLSVLLEDLQEVLAVDDTLASSQAKGANGASLTQEKQAMIEETKGNVTKPKKSQKSPPVNKK